jgi:hypothetical protein
MKEKSAIVDKISIHMTKKWYHAEFLLIKINFKNLILCNITITLLIYVVNYLLVQSFKLY